MAAIDSQTFIPKFDLESALALYKSNIETFVAAQKVMFDFSQTLTRRQIESVKDSFAKAESLMKGFDGKTQPQSFVEDARAAVEKAMADVKEAMDMGLKAQNEVVDLFVKRAAANLDSAKSMAA